MVDFYKALFSKDSLNMQIQTEIIDDLDFSLSDAEQEQCEGLFTEDELFAALKGFQTGKSPGSDGLPIEFNSAFWDLLYDPLLSILNDCFQVGSLCSVLGRSIFSNLQLICDTLDMINKTYETRILVTLDQMKAFDRVDHDFLMRVSSLVLDHLFVAGFLFSILCFRGSFVMASFLLLFS